MEVCFGIPADIDRWMDLVRRAANLDSWRKRYRWN